ncbi:hypothetical protein CLIB1444_03S04214 [[Candida] jaroonii]|uniref:Uncharacterized protein n=1 Tax=[Candida] jaroonii TaxID=467808 RepID=A0ACA9Y5P1_9ASCO|nr:hypothetical protein CLIB1444_03S04214 [[Candida] jaroonii]
MDSPVKYLSAYGLLSSIALGYTIYDARNNSNNYFTLLFRLTEGFNLGVVFNTILCGFIMVGLFLQYLLFGELRNIEKTHIYERLVQFIINLLLTFTVQDKNLMLKCFLFMTSLLSKILHSILFDRIDHINVTIANTLIDGSHTKWEVSLLYLKSKIYYINIIFFSMDLLMAKFLFFDVFQGINSVICLLFGFEFAMLGLKCLTTLCQTILTVYEQVVYPNNDEDFEFDSDVELNEDGEDEQDEEVDSDNLEQIHDKIWESKPIYSKGIDFISACLRCVSYLGFLYLLIYHSSMILPFNVIQGIIGSAANAFNEFKQLKLIMQSLSKLSTHLPDATEDDLRNGNDTCTVCRDRMITAKQFERKYKKKLPNSKKVKVLPCKHMVHLDCFKPWFETHGNCTMCRQPVFPEDQPNVSSSSPPEPPVAPNGIHHPPPPLPPPPLGQPPLNTFEETLRNMRNMRETRIPERRERFNIDGDPNNIANPPPNETPVNNETPQERPESPPIPEAVREEDTQTSNEQSSNQNSNQNSRPQEQPSNTDGFHHINLPTTAIIPPGSTILPISRAIIPGSNYEIRINHHTTINMVMRTREPGRELNIIDPNFHQNQSNSED